MGWKGLISNVIHQEVVVKIAKGTARRVVTAVVDRAEEEIDQRTDNPTIELAAEVGLRKVEEELGAIIDNKPPENPGAVRVIEDLRKAKEGIVKIHDNYRVDPVERKVVLVDNGKGAFGPRDKKQTVTVLGVTVGVFPIYNFIFGKLLGLAGQPGAVDFFADTEVQYVVIPILGGIIGYVASRLQDNG